MGICIGSIGIMEKKMETTFMGYVGQGFRVQVIIGIICSLSAPPNYSCSFYQYCSELYIMKAASPILLHDSWGPCGP